MTEKSGLKSGCVCNLARKPVAAVDAEGVNGKRSDGCVIVEDIYAGVYWNCHVTEYTQQAAEYATGRHVKRGRAWVCARNGTMATALDWQWARVEMCSPIGPSWRTTHHRHYEHWVNAPLSSVRTCRGLHALASERASLTAPVRWLHNAYTCGYLRSTGFCPTLSADTRDPGLQSLSLLSTVRGFSQRNCREFSIVELTDGFTRETVLVEFVDLVFFKARISIS